MPRLRVIADRMHRANYIEVVLDFGQWMAQRSRPEAVTAQHVRAHFPVSYATSFRWLNAWRSVNGLPVIGDSSPQHRNRKKVTQ